MVLDWDGEIWAVGFDTNSWHSLNKSVSVLEVMRLTAISILKTLKAFWDKRYGKIRKLLSKLGFSKLRKL